MLTALIILFFLTLAAFVALVVIRRGRPEPLPKEEPDASEYRALERYRQLDAKHEEYKPKYTAAKWTAFGLLAVTIILTVWSSLVAVPTRNVGVVTTFGRPHDETLSNGLHIKAPWDDVWNFDAAVQTDKFTGNEDKDDLKTTHTCTTVRIGNQSTACVDNSIRWQIVPDEADVLYQDYKDFDNVRDSLVTRQLITALNEAFSTYDPLNNIDENGQP